MNTTWIAGILAAGLLGTILSTGPLLTYAADNSSAASERPSSRFQGQRADYDAEPRLPNKRVDVDRLIGRLKELGVNTYYWLIYHGVHDWDDLAIFLPKAAEAKIDVWAYLVPPTEPQSEPFRFDYLRWADEIARLSVRYPNLTGWVIDDFGYNVKLFTPAYVREMQARAKKINSRLAFLPLIYFREVTPKFVEQYGDAIDGVVVAYPRDRRDIDNAEAVLSGASDIPGQLRCPSGTPSAAGDCAAATISAKVLPGQRHVVRFQDRDSFQGPTKGYHFMQLLVDGQVAWEEDVAGGAVGWQHRSVDIGSYVQNKANVALTFRLLDKKGVSHFGVCWDLADISAEGLETAADFRHPEQWQPSHRGVLESSFGPISRKETGRPRKSFMVMTAGEAHEFRARHGDPASGERIAEWVGMCLQAQRDGKCDGVVTYCLDKSAKSEAFPPVAKRFRE